MMPKRRPVNLPIVSAAEQMYEHAQAKALPDPRDGLKESAGYDHPQPVEWDRPNLAFHRRVLGVCWLIYGVLSLLAAVLMVMYSGTATVMFGALLSRVPDPYTLMSLFHLIYGVAVGLAVLCGALGVLAGITLLSGSGAGRILALAAAFLSISRFPLGTTLGVYTLVVLLR